MQTLLVNYTKIFYKTELAQYLRMQCYFGNSRDDVDRNGQVEVLNWKNINHTVEVNKLTLKYVRRKTAAKTAIQYNIVNATKTTVYSAVQFLILTHTAESNDNVYPSSLYTM